MGKIHRLPTYGNVELRGSYEAKVVVRVVIEMVYRVAKWIVPIVVFALVEHLSGASAWAP